MKMFLSPDFKDIQMEANPTDYITPNEWPNIFKNIVYLQ